MGFRPRSSLPSLVSLAIAMFGLFLAVVFVYNATAGARHSEVFPVDESLVAFGRVSFLISLAAAAAAVLLWLVRARPGVKVPDAEEAGALAPAVGLVRMAGGFVQRLHATVLATGAILGAAAFGLVGASSLVADGTPYAPFPIPGKIGVIWLDNWQVQVTVWAMLLASLLVWFWLSEYLWVRRLRSAWGMQVPEV